MKDNEEAAKMSTCLSDLHLSSSPDLLWLWVHSLIQASSISLMRVIQIYYIALLLYSFVLAAMGVQSATNNILHYLIM